MTDRPIRPGVLHHLVKQLGTPSRVKLQKMSYLLQEGLGAGTGYRFKMHHYGPNSDELTNVMDWMRATGHLEIWNEKDSRAYLVIVKREPEEEWPEAAVPEMEKLDKLLAALAGRPDEYLELLARVHFVRRIQADEPREKILEIISAMNRKILPASIDAAYTELEELGML